MYITVSTVMGKTITHHQKAWKKRRLQVSAVMISAAFLCIFTAQDTLEGIQSSLNAEAGIGQVGLSVSYGCFIFSSFMIGPLCARKLGPKWAIFVGFIPYVIYAATNLHITWYTLVPASAFGD